LTSTIYIRLKRPEYILVFFALPVIYLFAMSLSEYSTTEGVVWTLSLANYRDAVTDFFFWEVSCRTFRVRSRSRSALQAMAFAYSRTKRGLNGRLEITIIQFICKYNFAYETQLD
jgi:ABC-type spermidine/putrescine transport system permease subunit II